MSQNRSSAVMAQRKEPHDSLEYFPTPPWATRALCEWLKERGCRPAQMSAWDPACGEGHMVRPLSEYFGWTIASDIHKYCHVGMLKDFLFPPHEIEADWIITNPPFRLADQFAATGCLLAKHGAAMLVRTAFLESADRYQSLFNVTPPSDILQFVERVPMLKGRLDRKASTATAYAWIVWRKGQMPGTRFHWLAPCRKRLERDPDYEEA